MYHLLPWYQVPGSCYYGPGRVYIYLVFCGSTIINTSYQKLPFGSTINLLIALPGDRPHSRGRTSRTCPPPEEARRKTGNRTTVAAGAAAAVDAAGEFAAAGAAAAAAVAAAAVAVAGAAGAVVAAAGAAPAPADTFLRCLSPLQNPHRCRRRGHHHPPHQQKGRQCRHD